MSNAVFKLVNLYDLWEDELDKLNYPPLTIAGVKHHQDEILKLSNGLISLSALSSTVMYDEFIQLGLPSLVADEFIFSLYKTTTQYIENKTREKFFYTSQGYEITNSGTIIILSNH